MARHLLVTNDYLPKTGGIQVYLHELWQRLEDGRAVVLTATSSPNAAAFDAQTTVEIERIPQKTLYFPSRRVFRQIEDAIERHQPEIVILDPAWPLGLLGPFLSRPYGVILHGAEVTIPGRLPLVASTLRRVLRCATFAIAAGSYPEAEARRNAAEFTPPIVQIPVGVETRRFRPIAPSAREAVRARFGASATSFSIASYSRLVPRKGMDTLIRAAAILRDEIPELTVSIGGSGRDRARLERLARRLHAPVTFVGRVSDEDLSDWLASSDIMVMDCRSRWLGLEQEGFGIVFLEAAAAGIPQIAGRSGGSHEAVRNGETGLVVDNPRSVKALAAAIRSMHADSERRLVMGERARIVAEEIYDWNILATELGRQLSPFDSPVPSTVIAVEVGE